ncbi:alcohol oxidase [Obba rivulosa]|uniref:Alcohol oxidase n=1 Tax=Obba rivulosa TaxID=1052685 RepID=A0A8E2ARE3_9APHY|nr:alcohol oxidase [Obba rivulosa]
MSLDARDPSSQLPSSIQALETHAEHDAFCSDALSLRRRNIIYNGQISGSYDFVIVGGGTSGLVLASRLSEDSNTTVLVLEAGDTGDAVSSSIDIPGNAYYSFLLGSSYDWAYTTVPQPSAGNLTLPWPRGKLLSGLSTINGMYLVHFIAMEVDAWSGMVDDGSLWSWDNLFSAMRMSETFTPPSPQIPNSSHGFSGPLHSSYRDYIIPAVGDWTQTLTDIGIPGTVDSNGGDGWGAFIATLSIKPSNWTRSYSRSAYIDPLPPRPTWRFSQMAPARGAPVNTVGVRKETVFASGAIGSPHVLMLSGVGPADILQAAGVPIQVALPGVGQHLQDHISSQVVWPKSEGMAPNGTSSPFLSFINSATAYANITNLLGDSAFAFQSQIAGQLPQSSATLAPSQYPEVVAGYEAIYNITLRQFLMSPVGQVEILFSLTGTALGAQSVAIQAALQHPFSQGRIWINSSDPFDYPVIDPQYLSHSADTVILREGLKLARTLGNTSPLSSAMQTELVPGPSVSSDDDWDAWLATQIGTEYHPSCSCAMLPQSQGGVVDANLKVYGLANVRVADASVFPIQFAAHLQAPTYGLAEQAAQIIRATYNGVGLPTSTSSASSTTSPTTPTTVGSNGALPSGPRSQVLYATSAVLLMIAFYVL